MPFLSVSDVARRLRVRPRDVSDLFYQRVVADDQCPIVAGRRLIPADRLDGIASALARCGRLVNDAKADAARRH